MADDTQELQAAIDAGGIVSLQRDRWYTCAGQLTIQDSDYVRIEGPGILVYSGTKSPFLAINSTTFTSLYRLRAFYSNPNFQGVLVQTSASGQRKSAVANLEVKNCFMMGHSAANSAHALLDLDNSNIVNVIGTQFANCQRGIRMATNGGTATVLVNIVGCSFLGCDRGSIVSFLGSTLESINILGCAFEPRTDGRASGIDINGPGMAVAVNIQGNWFGDRIKDGGGPWITLKARGFNCKSNRFGSAGAGVEDYAIRIVAGSTSGDEGNVFDGRAMWWDP